MNRIVGLAGESPGTSVSASAPFGTWTCSTNGGTGRPGTTGEEPASGRPNPFAFAAATLHV